MKVRMIAGLTGTVDNVEWPKPGGVIELADDVAAEMIARGQAAPIKPAPEPAPVVETADAPEAETATVKRGPGRPKSR